MNGRGRTETRRAIPQGLIGTLVTSRSEKRGQLDRGRGGRNGLTGRIFRGRQVLREQVKGENIASAGTGSGGRR